MKILGFKIRKENTFINVFCNICLVLVIMGVAFVSIYTPVASMASLTKDDAIYHGNEQKNNVTLMINVYWGTEYIEPMLEILEQHKVTTTFFVGGMWVAENTEMINLIKTKGHEIGNHGYYHKDHSKLSLEQNKEEISSCHNIVKVTTGIEMTLFAPPSGSYSKSTLSAAKTLGYKTIMWSKDTIDWRDKNSDLIYSRATKDIKNGDLILMHPTEKTLQALDNILNFYEQNNFNVVPVSQNIM